MATAAVSTPHYVPYGILAQAWACKDRLMLVDGPAGTGKSRMLLERIDALARKYPRSRHFICRKTRKSITTTAQVTFESFVLRAGDGIKLKTTDQMYHYPNESVVGLLGLDDTEKTKSLECDTVYINEATELTQGDVEMLLRALRWPAMPWKQIAMDCNPDAPTHWLRIACDEHRITEFPSRHEDNPVLFDQATGKLTTYGAQYMGILESMTGVRLLRLRRGLWVQAEGVVYDTWDDAVHYVNWFRPPDDWPRYWAIDFGYNDPFVCGFFAKDPDGRLYLYKQIYYSGRLVEDHAQTILKIQSELKDPWPRDVFCDHDAEGRATLERHLGIKTTPAYKAIKEGIQAVQARLKVQGDGKPRYRVMRDTLYETDPKLKERGVPTDGPSERAGWVWDVRNNRNKGEIPVDKDNHFMDTERYLIATLDLDPASERAEKGASLW